MKTHYKTSVDCCKPFMEALNASDVVYAQPLVGDYVVVFDSPGKVIHMQVGMRTWTKTYLGIELVPPTAWASLKAFIEWVKSN